MRETEYFAGKPARDLVTQLDLNTGEWRKYADRTGLHRKWRRSYRLYYGKHFFKDSSFQDSEIIRGGDRGEYAMFAVNHYRNLIKHTLVMTTSQKPAFNVKAINTDPESVQQAKIGKNVLEYYYDQKKIGMYLKNAAEMSQVFAKSFVFVLWEPNLGKPRNVQPVMDDQGQPVLDDQGQPKEKLVYEGDVGVYVRSPYDVYTDASSEDYTKNQWARVRLNQNKFDLAAQYPQFHEDIVKLPVVNEGDSFNFLSFQDGRQTADVNVYYFIHKRTRAMPNGRLIIYCTPEVILYDGPTPYDEHLPVFRIVPGEIFGTTEGYSDFFDLMGIQEAIDTLVSIVFTNQNASGIQKYWMPNNGNLTSTQVSKGLALLKSEPGTMPQALQLTASPKEIFESIPMLQKFMETLSGINSVARGDPEHSLKSGIAIAYVQAMAAQYTSGFQQSWAELNQDVASFILWLLKKFANTERMIAVAGKRNRNSMTSFTKDNLKNVDRCTVEMGNPITQTVAGRLEIAQDLIQNGMIKTPQEYIEVLESGNIDTMLENEEAQLDLIRRENDSLRDGKPVIAAPGDKHLLHCQEHMTEASDPELRSRAAQGDQMANKILNGVLDHVQDHMTKYKTQDPIWSMISGEPPAPPPPPPPGQGMPGPMAGPPQGPPPGPPHNNPGAPHNVPHGTSHGHKTGSAISKLETVAPNGLGPIPRLPANLQPNAQGR